MRRFRINRYDSFGSELFRRDHAADPAALCGRLMEGFKGSRSEMAERLRNPRRLWKHRFELSLKTRVRRLEQAIADKHPARSDSELIWHAVQIAALLLRNRTKRNIKP